MCPGLILEKHVMSAQQLSEHASTVYVWSPADVFAGLLTDGPACTLKNQLTGNEETFMQLVCLGSQEVRSLSQFFSDF